MIARQHRFHGYNSLRYVYQNGKWVRNEQLSLRYALNQRRDKYRVAVVVSRKISKLAVIRNRLRRRIFEIVRLQQTAIDQPYDLVFTIVDEKLKDLPYNELQTLVTKQLHQAGVLNSSSNATHAMINAKET